MIIYFNITFLQAKRDFVRSRVVVVFYAVFLANQKKICFFLNQISWLLPKVNPSQNTQISYLPVEWEKSRSAWNFMFYNLAGVTKSNVDIHDDEKEWLRVWSV